MISMRLMRYGAKKKPSYRIVVIDSRRATKSEALDVIGSYDPLKEPAEIKINYDKAKSWLDKGVRASQTVQSLLQKVSRSKKLSD